jgi:hypothetical protein
MVPAAHTVLAWFSRPFAQPRLVRGVLHNRNSSNGLGFYHSSRWHLGLSMTGMFISCGVIGSLAEKGNWIAALTKRGLMHHDTETGKLVWQDQNEEIH